MELLEHASLPVFSLCAALLVVKMMLVGHWTGMVRFLRRKFLNPEDASVFLRGQAEAVAVEHPDVDRALRAHRNDLESTVPFLAIGLPYLAIDPSPGRATLLIVGFTVARFVFSLFYLLKLQPWRSLSFVVGEIFLVVMLFDMACWGYTHLG